MWLIRPTAVTPPRALPPRLFYSPAEALPKRSPRSADKLRAQPTLGGSRVPIIHGGTHRILNGLYQPEGEPCLSRPAGGSEVLTDVIGETPYPSRRQSKRTPIDFNQLDFFFLPSYIPSDIVPRDLLRAAVRRTGPASRPDQRARNPKNSR